MKGSVYKRTNGWEFRHDIDPDPLTGKRRTTSRGGFKTKTEASRAMRDSITQFEEGKRVAPSRRTVEEFTAEWLAAVRPAVAKGTWAKYRNYLTLYVVPVIGPTPLQDLTARRLDLLYGHLLDKGRLRQRGGQGQGLAPATVAVVHQTLSRALGDAVKWGYLRRNPAEDAHRPRVGRRAPTVWTPEQVRAFLDHIRDDRLYAMYLLLVTTGVRRGTLAGLRRADVDLELATVSPITTRVVIDGKADDGEQKTVNAYRPLSLDPLTRDALRAYVAVWEENRRTFGHTTDRLFCWPDGTAIHPDTITDWFQGHARAVGLPVIRLHDVRHSYATAALKSGVHPKVVSERLGHASVAFTLSFYSHVIPGMDKDAADQIAGVILGTPNPPGPQEEPEPPAADDETGESGPQVAGT
ncbi:tyrosine-type recombinase/integrase [Parafrankia sp. EUN1f]|uniref:site-specific integrase n=1 Tax=Parafrankia sp. EUN1f TaxID=102897 RepID=UPI0001C46911|nr:tyrosine-type recombinase/integrase [Parafrankia sp. EUN1f]EFC80274.1 integrase family protein [Parafrankia sp. EUN1f]